MTAPTYTCDLALTGVLLEDAQARMRSIDGEGHMVPVLCLLIETESVTRGHAVIEEPFPVGHQAQCEARARELRKGTRVKVQAPSVGIQLLVRNASHVYLLKAEETAAAAEAGA